MRGKARRVRGEIEEQVAEELNFTFVNWAEQPGGRIEVVAVEEVGEDFVIDLEVELEIEGA